MRNGHFKWISRESVKESCNAKWTGLMVAAITAFGADGCMQTAVVMHAIIANQIINHALIRLRAAKWRGL